MECWTESKAKRFNDSEKLSKDEYVKKLTSLMREKEKKLKRTKKKVC